MDRDRNMTITLDRIVVEDTRTLTVQDKRSDFGIVLSQPEEGSQYNFGIIDVEFELDSAGKHECMFLVNDEMSSGWQVNKRLKEVSASRRFQSEEIPAGNNKGRIKCSRGEQYDYSSIVHFRIGDVMKREDISTELLDMISKVRGEINGFEPSMQKLFEHIGMKQDLLDYNEQIKRLKQEYEVSISAGSSVEAVEEKKQALLDEIDRVKHKIPSEIVFRNRHEAIIYLPRENYDELLQGYMEAQVEFKKTEFNAQATRDLQDKLLVKKLTQRVTVKADDVTEITKVTKELDGIDLVREMGYTMDELRIIEYIPEDVADSVVFMSPMQRVSQSYYEVKLEDGKISYYFMKDLDEQKVKELSTLVLLREGVSVIISEPEEGENEITGLSIVDFGSSFGGIILYVMIFIIVIAGGSLFIPGMPMSRLLQKDPEKELTGYLTQVISDVEQKGVSASLGLFPRALDLYEALGEEQRAQFTPMLAYLANCLEEESVTQDINKTMQSIGFQMRLYAFDPVLYQETVKNFNDIMQRISGMGQEQQQKLAEPAGALYNALMALQQTEAR
jgi:hypothetical protein